MISTSCILIDMPLCGDLSARCHTHIHTDTPYTQIQTLTHTLTHIHTHSCANTTQWERTTHIIYHTTPVNGDMVKSETGAGGESRKRRK